MNIPDSIIFDMDGTLWDPMDLYVSAWNNGLKEAGVNKTVTSKDLKPLMGVEGSKVLSTVLPQQSESEREHIYEYINRQRAELIKQGKGILFDGMRDGLKILSEKYKLFIVSNCPHGIIPLFMERAGISEYITDELEYGFNKMPKHHNIKLLRDKHHLTDPIYVGDTDGDRQQSEKAKIPFIFLSCGFGEAEKYDLTFSNFRSFTDYFASLN